MVLCKSAAGKMDKLKSEKIEDQRLLIEFQQGQINSEQDTVKSEMKSWADIVKKNTSQRNGKQLIENSVKQAVRTVNEEERRSKNLMIYGCTEIENEVHFEVQKIVNDVLSETKICPTPRAQAVYRMGIKEPGKTRPIKVEFFGASEVESVLMHARNLKNSRTHNNVYLGPDRTKEESIAHSQLVKEMKQMIEKDPKKHYFIRNKKICSADKDLSKLQKPAITNPSS